MQTIAKLAARWCSARNNWITAWPRPAVADEQPSPAQLPECTLECPNAHSHAETVAGAILKVANELLPFARVAGVGTIEMHRLLRDLQANLDFLMDPLLNAAPSFVEEHLKPSVAKTIDEIDLIVRELESQDNAAKRGEAPSAPRKLNELDVRTIDILKNADYAIKLDDLIRRARPVITEDSYRRRLRHLDREGLVGRDGKGRYWHPGVKKTGH